ncbi:HAMP domain-containing sensor histidine kinase [Pediococcus claussenii]|uniref:Signal transduction histidine-protein kinase ArlS n=1 Tax=Pediococcus claussenii (strain ATCC BAA-344 / DSM 14800 / JCM 18046 / KCTC 3811 / LMG 21948 / P06) TaxID=701521 RepID=G8PDP5_PEDCP|nr:HAMP domain-containing histidine kinase [Pediococcus claussenii]AEV95380.1 Two-component system, sensor histidine kinase [Pediococcus claussenii ATCC BAA-344]
MNNGDIKEARRISLKWKWAISTGMGFLVIFALFSFFIFRSITFSMYEQERNSVDLTLNQIGNRLGSETKISSSGIDLLRPENQYLDRSSHQNNNLYTNSLFTSLARQDIVVSIYDLNGKNVFTSREDPVKFKRVDQQQFSRKSGMLVGRKPIIGKENRPIGYAQVVNRLTSYKKNYNRLIWVFLLSTVTVFIIVSVFGYLIAAYFLRPINMVHETMVELENDPQTNSRIPNMKQNDELSDLATEFNNMVNRMQRYTEQQRQFVEDVSHELRTPVAVIEGHFKRLNRWGKDDPKIVDDSIESSLEETQRMKSLVSEMLDLTRADQIEINYANETTDVVKLVTQVYNDFKMIHPEFKFMLDNDVMGDPIVQIYRNHFEQVLIILLDNAVKYSGKRKEIHMSLSSNTQSVEIAVQDFGEGIAEDSAKQVFNRFYRVDKARSRDKGGNGLGLSIAQRLIEEYQGNISLESSLGHGSIFRIELPILSR